METIAPTLVLLNWVQRKIETGDSVRTALKELPESLSTEIHREVSRFLWVKTQGFDLEGFLAALPTMHRQQLYRVFDRGLRGESILPILKQLQDDWNEQAQLQVDEFLHLLPLKMLIPLVLFIFPAIALVMVGPIVLSFVSGWG